MSICRIWSCSEFVLDIKQFAAFSVLSLAILDLMLPDINGFSICQKIRDKHTYPIIMLTAKDEETDKITGLFFY